MTLIQQLQDIIAITDPKFISAKVKRDTNLYAQVEPFYGTTISEKIYNVLAPNENVCNYGNFKKFTSSTIGYRNCGKAATCRCTSESVAQKVSDTKQLYSIAKKDAINDKRVVTCLEKYGVTNNGQTVIAKQKHTEVYQNKEDVNRISSKIAQTKLQTYGSKTYNNSEQAKQTWNEKRDAGYWYAYRPDKRIQTLNDLNDLTELYNTKSVYEIALYCNVHPNTVHRYLTMQGIRKPFTSSYEQELIIFLQSLGITNIVTNKRRLISIKKEIDIFLPDFNVAIEYNGVYWHHDKINHITKTYHYDKFKSCEDSGIQLITIFSHIWDTKKDIIKRAIIHKLKLNTADRVFARKCKIQEISHIESKIFLEQYHVQGYARATHSYGLFYQDNIVAMMSFSKSSSRPGIGRKSESEYELVRYASKLSVTGGASKLLHHFIKQYAPDKIQSYSSNEWSNGKLYSTLHFKLEHEVKPGYWYFDPKQKKMYHRYNFAKHILVKAGHDAKLTEFEITDQLGLLRIWDCGNRSWMLDLTASNP